MRSDLHESFSERKPAVPPSERATGLVFAGVAAIVALIWRASPGVFWAAVAAATVLAAVSLVRPAILKPLNVIWFRIGLLLHRVMGPLVLFLLFALVFTPAGLLIRTRYDPLRSKRAKKNATYWITRGTDGASARSMKNQF